MLPGTVPAQGDKHMQANVGGIDRIARIVVGLILVALAALGNIGTWGWIVGGIVLATGLFRFCGLYTVLGMNTCALPEKKA